jgi:hypothetical protein
MISGRIRMLGSKSDFWVKNVLFGLLFLKHKLHLILPMIMQKIQRLVNFKGIKLALKNLGRFLSLTASRAVLRNKYQHFDLYLQYKTLRSYNFE